MCCTEREAKAASLKPADHHALFSGNTDDHFRLGIKQTRQARAMAGALRYSRTRLLLTCAVLSCSLNIARSWQAFAQQTKHKLLT